MSFHDMALEEPEKVYHAFVLGLLVSLSKTHDVKSNRESGFGRYDVCLIPKDPSKLGIIIEFKKADLQGSLEKAADDALKQIEKQKYSTELLNLGITNLLCLGIACQGKRIFVKNQTF